LIPSPKKSDLNDALWVHAASIGEAVIADNLIKYIDNRGKIKKFIITTNTYYTKDLLQKKANANIHIYALPFDFLFSVKRFLNQGNPRGLLIVETEIWPNLIWQAKKRGMPIIILNGRISDRTFKNYLRFSFFIKNVLSHVDLVLAQSEEHRDRFMKIGMDPAKVITSGNIKYFRELEDAGSISEKEKIITFGSIKEKELHDIYATIKSIKSVFPDYRIFIAPRELHLTSTIEKDLSSSFSVMRYSDFKNRPDTGIDIVVVDTIGDLFPIYAKSKVAFVGGSLAPYGGQNILEPLFFSTPVLFGPSIENFKDIAQKVIKYHAGIMVKNAGELTENITVLLNDNSLWQRMGENAKSVVKEQTKAMEKTVELIMATIKANQ
jgi:3-deoxy-D-manno-octulosonic-acid transferase